MFHPVAIGDGDDGDDGDGEKDAGDAREFRAAEDGEDDRERVQVYALPDDARIGHVIVNDAQHDEEEEDRERLSRRMKTGEYDSEHSNDERAGERDKLKQARDDAEHQRVRDADDAKPDSADRADEQARDQLRANISGERRVDILKQLIATPAQTPTRKHAQSRAAKRVCVFQQKEREDRNKYKPRDVCEQSGGAKQRRAD